MNLEEISNGSHTDAEQVAPWKIWTKRKHMAVHPGTITRWPSCPRILNKEGGNYNTNKKCPVSVSLYS